MALPFSSQQDAGLKVRKPAIAGEKISSLLLSWEIYVILFAAAFLRLFNIDRVVFGQDEADVFQLAHSAFAYGLWPLTSNRASIGNLNPPLVVYLFMLPASLSANPLWGEVMVALFNTVAVLLTYFFTRRYYGRLAGIIAALLFATSAGAWQYSRNIWPQNFLPFFVLLFIWFLFRGVVERKKGWFFPAVTLFGILYQLHGSTLFLIFPLLAAVLLAFKTIRPRELVFAAMVLLVLYMPFVFWEFHNNFADIKQMLMSTGNKLHIDLEAAHFYLFFIHPTLASPYLDPGARSRDNHLLLPNAHSILITTPLRHLTLLLKGDFYFEILLLLGGITTAVVLVLFARRPGTSKTSNAIWTKKGLLGWWTDFQATPSRQGLLLLLLWQLAPLAVLTGHSIVLFAHYFIFLLPGEFILIALFVSKAIDFLQKEQPRWSRQVYYGMSILIALVILAQSIGSGSTLIDLTTGNFDARSVSPHFSDLQSQQNALQDADQLAVRRGIHRIYVMESSDNANAMDYLSQQLKTPVELNNAEHCFVLPAPEAGPVVFLATPNSSLADTMLSNYTNATLVSEPAHLGGEPYKLYILTAKPLPASLPHTFTHSLQLVSRSAYQLQNANTRWLVSRWKILDTQKAAVRTDYDYTFQVSPGSASANLACHPTATWTGDQLFTTQQLKAQSVLPSQLTMQISTAITHPTIVHVGSLTMTIFWNEETPAQQLLTIDQKKSVTLPVVTTS